MKTKIFLAAAAVAAVLAGCEKKQSPVTVADNGGETSELSICIPLGGQTKAAGTVQTADEDNLNSVQVFVFTSNGTLESYKSATTGNLEIACTRGSKQVVALVNAPVIRDITSITSISALSGQVTTLLGDNKAKSFYMYGMKHVSVDAASVAVTLEVKRLVAKVVIQKITNRIAVSQYKSSPIEVTGIYLINVASALEFSGRGDPTDWLNKRKNTMKSDCLFYEKPTSCYIECDESESKAHYFYCYPNPVENDTADAEWSPRHTRLVVETRIGNNTFYYPITLPKLAANTVYTIGELTITRTGALDPDVIDVTGSATFTITVAPWNNETVSPVTI